jgi:alkanesulfonate monooxygenase SsuD/methylene tetrahydromethanopterin reductase-like flavin-dependent oxidoreductase (luciferase family)
MSRPREKRNRIVGLSAGGGAIIPSRAMRRCWIARDDTQLARQRGGRDDTNSFFRGSAAMEFGSFMEFPPVSATGDGAAFDQALAEIETAERVGLDVAWLAELHGAPERSVLSAPMMVASAIAARTSRIKIGIAVQVLPLSHPLRLAEEAATIDQISHGRLIYGIGRSGVVRTYEDYGISYAESRERFAETLEILQLAWTQPAFSYDGRYYSFTNVSLTPKPYQKPYPELRMAAATPETFPQIGRLGLPIFVAVRQGPFSQLAEHIKAYREAYGAAGHKGRGKVFLRVPAYLAETRERARAEAEESLMGFFRYQAELGRDSALRAGGEVAVQRLRRVERLEALTYDEALATQVLIDEPNGFAARLREVDDEIGLDGILAELNCGGKIPQHRVLNALKLLCEEVKPRFH